MSNSAIDSDFSAFDGKNKKSQTNVPFPFIQTGKIFLRSLIFPPFPQLFFPSLLIIMFKKKKRRIAVVVTSSFESKQIYESFPQYLDKEEEKKTAWPFF